MAASERQKRPVIITRPEPDGSAVAAMIAAMGLLPVLSPTMKVVNTGEKPNLDRVAALAFTSANGVRAFAKVCEERKLPVFAVGSATNEAARKIGFATVEAAEGDLPSLVKLIKQLHEGGEILHVAGRDRAGNLVALLKIEGISAQRSVLYLAKPIATLSSEACSLIADMTTNPWVTLFSPRTADIFLKQVAAAGLEADLARVSAACLSEAVADKLVGKKFNAIEIAEHRAAEALIDLITRRQNA